MWKTWEVFAGVFPCDTWRLSFLGRMQDSTYVLKGYVGLLQGLLNVSSLPKKKWRLSSLGEKKELLDILAFFDSLKLYHYPAASSEIAEKRLVQWQPELVSEYASSDEIRARGGIKKIYSDIGVYSKESLAKYLTDLSRSLNRNPDTKRPDVKFCLALAILDHGILLGYSTDLGWSFMDINQYPPKYFKTSEVEKLVECIFKAFPSSSALDRSHTDRTIYVNCLTTSDYAQEVSPVKAAHINTRHLNIHKYIKEKSLDEPLWIELLLMSGMLGYSDVIKLLIAAKVDINQADKIGRTPTFLAAQYGHTKALKLLIDAEGDFNKPDNRGITPIWMAARYGHTKVLKLLIEAEADFRTPYKITKKRLKALADIQPKPVGIRMQRFINQYEPNKTGDILVMPKDIAWLFGHTDIVHQLIRLEEKSHKTPPHLVKAILSLSDFESRLPGLSSLMENKVYTHIIEPIEQIIPAHKKTVGKDLDLHVFFKECAYYFKNAQTHFELNLFHKIAGQFIDSVINPAFKGLDNNSVKLFKEEKLDAQTTIDAFKETVDLSSQAYDEGTAIKPKSV